VYRDLRWRKGFWTTTVVVMVSCVLPTDEKIQLLTDQGPFQAVEDIAPGTLLKRSHIQAIQPPGGLVPPPSLISLSDLRGRVVSEQILEGEIIRPERLSAPDLRQTMSARIDAAKRASFVSSTDPVTRRLQVNTTVDVLAERAGHGCLLFDNARVLDVGDAGVWLEAYPVEVARRVGTDELVVLQRNPADRSPSNLPVCGAGP